MVWKALLYKSYCISRCHYIKTTFEIILPLLVLCLPIYIKYISIAENSGPTTSYTQLEIIQDKISKSWYLDDLSNANFKIFYTPDNVFTRTLMENVKTSMNKESEIDGFHNESSIEVSFMKNENECIGKFKCYGVIFSISENSTDTPLHLKYRMRPVNSYKFHTDILFPTFYVNDPNLEVFHFYMEERFFGLQVAIDEAFYKLIGGKAINWNMQAFPYPEHKREPKKPPNPYPKSVQTTCVVGFMYSFLRVLDTAIHEKASGITERMKMFGLSDLMLLSNYHLDVFTRYFFTTAMFAGLTKLELGGSSLLNYSNYIIVWFLLLLHCAQSVSFYLVTSSLFNNSALGTAISNVVYLGLWMAFDVIVTLGRLTVITQFISSFIPPLGVMWAFQIVTGYEDAGTGATFTNLFNLPPDTLCDLPLSVIMLGMALGTILNSIIYIYMINIKPGPYGNAKPWYYIFPNKIGNICNRVNAKAFQNESDGDSETEGLYEKVSSNAEVGLKIVNLHKKFGYFTSVKNLSLDIYVGQITVLLGHNGAGKTTTMSMLTGMFSPTSGNAIYRSYDIFENLNKFRQELGLCPQSDLLHNDLSASQQIIFFSMIKGISKSEATRSCHTILNEVGLAGKENSLEKELSGGMKRKLCLALCLIGKPKVIILDEPTSGLDPESRRELWNILLNLRKDRIMMITTHFMEEADALGDQIAIMDHGEIKCYGTPMFLKKHYGAGYHITISCSNLRKFNTIIDIVSSKVPEATVINKTEELIEFSMPSYKSGDFPALFEILETNTTLQISRIGITCTTMEDVFLKVQEEAQDKGIKQMTTQKPDIFMSQVSNTGCLKVFFSRLSALVIKNILCTRGKWLATLFMVLIAPVLISYAAISLTNLVLRKTMDDTALQLNLNEYGATEVLLTKSNRPLMEKEFCRLITEQGSNCSFIDGNITDALLKAAIDDVENFRTHMIVAADFKESVPNILFSSLAQHSSVISLGLLYNTLIRSIPQIQNYSIEVINQPYGFKTTFCSTDVTVTKVTVGLFWMSMLSVALLIITENFIRNPHIERTSLLKHLELMTGLSPIIYWLSFFIWDIIVYTLSLTFLILVFLISDEKGLLSANGGLGVLFLLMFLFGVSGTWLAYLFSYLFKTDSRANLIYFLVVTFSGMAFVIGLILIPENSAYYFTTYIMRLNPYTPLAFGIQLFIGDTIENLRCSVCQSAQGTPDCISQLDIGYLTSLKTELLYLAFDWMLYFVIIMLIEYGVFSKFLNKVKSIYVGDIENSILRNVESDVAKEKDRVDAIRNLRGDEGAPIVIVDGLAKKYSRSFTAVHDVSFAAKEGECFGLLGVNGAGKSTTFNILTGIIPPSLGNATIKGHSLQTHKRKCLEYIGYCPQSSALSDSLTGRQLLTLFAKIRLPQPDNIDIVVASWISLLGLDEYCDKPCGNYSGGNKRKLSTALSFINNPNVIILDEPTSGVDPMTRRKLWEVLKECQSKKQTIIISSHSMDECEAVCDRLTIMAKGRMQCIGNIQHLKGLYGQGFTLMIKLKNEDENLRGLLKDEIEMKFQGRCNLKDEHMIILHYHLDDLSYKLSTIFKIMEQLKISFPNIDDYTVSDSNLEQVFLSFAKKKYD